MDFSPRWRGLPAWRQPSDTLPARTEAASLCVPSMNILIAEDDPVAAHVLRLTLQSMGHDVVSASTGDEAWNMFETTPSRVIVSDWMMPGMDGLELCRKIRGRPNTPYSYFIMLTAAYTETAHYTQAMSAGVDDFMAKPLERELLRSRLHVASRILHYTQEIRQLREIIPICSYCHSVRDDQDYWQAVELFIRDQTGSKISHGVCPECLRRQMADLERTGGHNGGCGLPVSEVAM